MASIPWPASKAAAGITISWGDFAIIATSVSYSRQAPGEIDITSMESTVVQDQANTNRRAIRKSVEFAVVDHGELSIEFVGHGGFTVEHIGLKKVLTVSGDAATNFPSGKQAFLTALSVQASAGELVRGNCTFRISDS